MLDLESEGLLEAWVEYSLVLTFYYWIFLFSRTKASDAYFGIIANFVYLRKISNDKHR